MNVCGGKHCGIYANIAIRLKFVAVFVACSRDITFKERYVYLACLCLARLCTDVVAERVASR